MIAVTSLSSYTYCARKLFIEKVLKIRPEIPKEALVKGTIRHKAYEEMHHAEEKILKLIDRKEKNFIYETFKINFLKAFKKTIIKHKDDLRSIHIPLTDFYNVAKRLIENEAEFRAGKTYDFIEHTGFLGKDLWENIMPKKKSEYRIASSNLGLRGVIDELEIHEDFFVPVEFKTGKTPDEGVWPGHKIQAGAYAMLLEDKFNVPVKKAVVRYLDSNKSREILINPFVKEEVKELLMKVEKLMKSCKIPDFAENKNKCKSCNLKEACYDNEAIKIKTKDLNRT